MLPPPPPLCSRLHTHTKRGDVFCVNLSLGPSGSLELCGDAEQEMMVSEESCLVEALTTLHCTLNSRLTLSLTHHRRKVPPLGCPYYSAILISVLLHTNLIDITSSIAGGKGLLCMALMKSATFS